MNQMKKVLTLAAAALTVAIVVPVASNARPETTKPGVIYVLKTVVDDKGIHIPKDQFTRNGISRYPRGALIRYDFVNRGTKPYAVHIWATDTVVMKPGARAVRLVNWQYRGTYYYWRVLRGHRLSPVGTIVIF